MNKYILILLLALFTIYYSIRVKNLSDYNNTLLVSIYKYASNKDEKCIEGSINNDGIILGYSGISVDVLNSYSNMKGIGFKKSLIEYKKNKCLINKEDNLDKYIISGNKYEKKVSLVIDINNMEYYNYLETISNSEKVELNYLVDINSKISKNVLFKTNKDNIKEFKKKVNSFYCVKNSSFEIIKYCKKHRINSILLTNYIEKDLLFNTKKILENGIIIFIKENKTNYNELLSTIKYIKSMGYNIVSVDELLS